MIPPNDFDGLLRHAKVLLDPDLAGPVIVGGALWSKLEAVAERVGLNQMVVITVITPDRNTSISEAGEADPQARPSATDYRFKQILLTYGGAHDPVRGFMPDNLPADKEGLLALALRDFPQRGTSHV